MAASLILHKRISTTLAKAKALRKYVEPILMKSKSDSTHNRRTVFSYLQNKDAVTMLFRDVAIKIAERQGGYTRILKTGNRLGDNAEMCFIELVDYNENFAAGKEAKKAAKPTRRRGGAKKKATTVTAGTEATTDTQVEDGIEDATIVEETPAPKKAKSKKAESESENGETESAE
jgi:large subunit ribosomal protein L17